MTAGRSSPPYRTAYQPNQARIKENLQQALLAVGLDQDQDKLRFHCEQVIRNYDPCISCATHFLDLQIQRR